MPGYMMPWDAIGALAIILLAVVSFMIRPATSGRRHQMGEGADYADSWAGFDAAESATLRGDPGRHGGGA